MIRKLFLCVVLVLLVFGCYKMIGGEINSIAGVKQLESSSQKLNTSLTRLEQMSTTEFQGKKEKLSKIIQNYKSSKKEYDSIVEQYSLNAGNSLLQAQENELKDIYDVDFLWTIIGNYATEEGVRVEFDIVKNVTSASSLSNTSDNYMVCDLLIALTGNYINLTDFIYDLEDDDRLNFEINDFVMEKSGSALKVTLRVNELKVNTANLIENSIKAQGSTEGDDSSETSEASTTNTTSTSNTTNTTNTTNTSSTTNSTNTTNTKKNEMTEMTDMMN